MLRDVAAWANSYGPVHSDGTRDLIKISEIWRPGVLRLGNWMGL